MTKLNIFLLIACIIFSLIGCAPIAIENSIVPSQTEPLSEFTIKQLPISINLQIDGGLAGYSITKPPSSFFGSATSVVLPVGKQLTKGIDEITKLVFKDVNRAASPKSQAILRIKLDNFKFDYWNTHFGFKVTYDTNLSVTSELIDQEGALIYRKTETVEQRGIKNIDPDSMRLKFSIGASEVLSTLTKMWMKSFAQDITGNEAVQNFTAKFPFVAATDTVPGPEIIILNPADNSTTNQDIINLIALVQSNEPVKEIKTSLNGRFLEQERGISVMPSQSASKIKLNKTIRLLHGENVINIMASGLAGGFSQKVIKVTRIEAGPHYIDDIDSGTKVGERFAVIVGISKYKHEDKGIPSLNKADNDASFFANFLKSDKGGKFKEKNVLLLTNEQATSASLRSALFTFLKGAIEEDLVIFFFSGQGASEPGNPDNYYLLTYDANPNDLPSTAIATWDVDTAFKRSIKAKRVVIIADASNVSGLGQEDNLRSIGQSNLINTYLKKLSRTSEGRAIFTSTQEGQLSINAYAKGMKTRIFTHYFLEALSGLGDENGDGIITLGEVIDYTTDLVSAASRGKQRPDVAGKFDRKLPLAVIKE